ncbi:hypothetical protein [Phreatobacter sp. AB_2022a]|uniref:hypothetical protein n=1 Tax=Phreatobacter sp. AB_2022a TaxID=3003134 RepID=UPI002286DF00|nr:hypothetical protein [Phreatobacter sp. AB_2022a]MCZ0735145.1 hypothetical protein [Phreatobacter sp. AB_2022a]
MSRIVLFLVAAGAVVLAQFADRRTAHLPGAESLAARQQAVDDAIVTGAVRRQLR